MNPLKSRPKAGKKSKPKTRDGKAGKKSKPKTRDSNAIQQGKAKRFQWTEGDMKAAHEAILGGMSQRKAAKQFNVPRATLQKLVNGKTSIGTKPGKKPLFGQALEKKLVDFAANRAALGVGFGKQQFLDYAGQLAKKHNIPLKKDKPSEKWWKLMKRRNANVRLRRPEGTASVRHMCMDRVKVGKYFHALKELLTEKKLLDSPAHVWNMDETGLQLEHKPRRVVAHKGAKYVQSRTSGNKETITIIACINAAGGYIPPHIIAKGKTQRALHGFDLESSPPGATWSVSSKGWTRQGIAKLWFEQTFLPNIGTARPQVLILDGHDSHNFVELIEMAIANNIEIVELPAHTSNWLQPCDRTVFKPLKDAYGDVCQQLMNDYPGVVVSHANFCGLLTKAWTRGLTPENIKSGFKACGIFPLNEEQIPQEAYLPNMLYRPAVEKSTNYNKENDVQRTACNNGEVEPLVIPAMVQKDSDTDKEQMNNHGTEPARIDSNDHRNPTQDEGAVTENRPCGILLALSAFECSLPAEKLNLFQQAYAAGEDAQFLQDGYYITWKGLKEISVLEEPSSLLDFSIASADLNLLEPAITQQNDDELNISLGPIDMDTLSGEVLEMQLGLPSIADNDNCEPSNEVQPLSSLINSGPTAQPEILISFPFQNSSSPLDQDSDVLPYPKPQLRQKKRKEGLKSNDKFFVLTSKEAYESKLRGKNAKIEKEQQKIEKQNLLQEKKEQLAKKKESKMKELCLQKEKNNAKKLSQKKELRKKPTKRKEVNWQCSGCHCFYFDENNPKYKETWIQCVECSKIRYHISCAVGHGKFDNDDFDGDFTCSVCFQ